ncbi:uncharacterized protein LOC127004357 isoform X2 [Eriocheir sinensis]|uniref:uncharacterized protein LOC127004357 isoform X2 n=1 Tax=Eriocheir sinensis TaxID=95602 RepID=UPI0021C651B9|nr:uncharacterized protein LOC127004357 isoform X2 [Eriocheir sinensis]
MAAGGGDAMTWLLLLLLPTLMMAGDFLNIRPVHEEGAPGGDAATREFTAESGAARLLGTSVSGVWTTVQPNTGASDRLSMAIKRRLLAEAEAVTRRYASTAVGGIVAGPPRTKKALAQRGGLRYLGNALARLDLSFFNANTSVDIVHGVEELAFLGVRGAQKVHMTQWRGRLILAVIESASVSLHVVEPGTHKVHSTMGPRGRHDCEFAPVAGGPLLLVCITAGEPEQFEEVFGNQTNTKGKVTVYEIKDNPMTSGGRYLSFHVVDDIGVEGPRDVEIWTQRNETFCVIVSGEAMVHVAGQQDHFNLHTSSTVYRLRGTHFDRYELLPGTNPVAAHHFEVNEFHYLAFANYQDNKGRHNCDSLIFRFCVDREHYIPFQAVKTRGARHMHSFTLGSRPLHNTFLAIANFCEDTQTGTCTHHTASEIYLYHLGKFVLFQEIKTAYAVQWMAVQVNATALLALASTVQGVTFYQYNGWKFVPAPHQPQHHPFSAGVTSLVTANWDGRLVLGVTNRDDEKAAGKPSLYSVSFTSSDKLKEVYQEVKGWCEDLRRRVNRTEVMELMRLVPTSLTTTGAHTFPNHITIRGNLTVFASSTVSKIFVRSSGQWIPNSGGSGRLEDRVSELEEAARQAHQRLGTAVLATGPATWPDLHFADVRVEGGHASLVGQVQATWINGRRTPDPEEVVPLHGANHFSSLTFAHVNLQAPTSADRLNGLPVTAYVTLNGRHELGGNITFQGPLMARSVAVTNTLDGVLVGHRSSLLTTHSQTHAGSLKCRSLVTDILDVSSVNGVPLAELLPRLVTHNANVTITGPLRVMGDLVHSGSVWVKDLTNLDLVNPLLTNERQQQVITGDHQVGMLATQAMAVEGRVNGVRVPANVFLNGKQYSYDVPRAAFRNLRADSLSVTRSLNTITITEGSLDILLLTGNQKVTAPKTFSSLHMLQRDSSGYGHVGVRRRRWSSGICGSPKTRESMNPKDRSEALLIALRGVAAAQDLRDLLAKAQPGQFIVPWRTWLFYTLLKMDVNCAFILLEDTNMLMFFDIVTNDWRNEDNETVMVLSHKDLTNMLTEVENYITEMTSWLHSIQFRWTDRFSLVSKAVRKVSDIRTSLNIVKILTELIITDYTMTPESSDHCRWLCAAPQSEMAGLANCTQAATLTLLAGQRISRYPVLGSGLMQLSKEQRQLLLDAAVQHDLGRLVEFLGAEDGLLAVLRAALYCGLTPRGQNYDGVVLEMLEDYERTLLFRATYMDKDDDISRDESMQHPDGGLNSSDDQAGLAGREKNSSDGTNSLIPPSPATHSTLNAASGGVEPSTLENSGEPAFFAEEANFIIEKSIVHETNNLFEAGEFPIDTKSSIEDEETEKSSTATSGSPSAPLTSSETEGSSTVPGESFFNVPEGSAEEDYTATQQSYSVLTEKSPVATEESSLTLTKELVYISNEKSLATIEAETDKSPPVAEETDGSGYIGSEEYTLVAAEASLFVENEKPQYIADEELNYGENGETSEYRIFSNANEKRSSKNIITLAKEISSLTISPEGSFSVAKDESFIPTEKSSSISTIDSPSEEYSAFPTHKFILEDSLTFIPNKYSSVAIDELPLGDSPAVSTVESNIGQPFVATKEVTIEYDYFRTESFDSATAGSSAIVILESTTGQSSVKNNRVSAVNEKSSGIALEQSSVDEYHIGGNLYVTTHVSTNADGKPRLPSTTNSMAKMISFEEVQDGNRDSQAKANFMAVASNAQAQVTRLSQENSPYEEAEEGDALQNKPQLVPSFFDFVDNLISLDWVWSKEKVEEPRHASCLNEENCTKLKRETPDENTRLHQVRKTTAALEASFSTPNAWDSRPSLTATPLLTQTQADSLAQVNENISILGEDATVALLQIQVKRENEMTPPEIAPLPNNWNRLKRHLTRNIENHEFSAPNGLLVTPENKYANILPVTNSNALYDTAVPTVAMPSARQHDDTSETYLSSQGGTSSPTLNLDHFQSSDVTGEPWTTPEETKSLRRREAIVEASSLATGVASGVTTVTVVQHLTTNIDCTNCMFQYQIFQTQPVLPSTERVSSPWMTACTVTQKTLTIVMSSSLTSIDCTNCAFQYQIYTTQPEVPGTECTSYVCVSGSTVTRQMSTTMISPSPSSVLTWSNAIVSSPFHPQYDGRTFGVGPREDPETFSRGKPELQTLASDSEHTHESSSSKTPTLPRQSDPECSHIPTDYYEDSVQKDSLVARLEVVLLYLKEIQTVEPLVLQDRMRVKPEQSEKNTLGRLNKVVEDTIHIVRQIINNLFHSLKTNEQKLIIESERFRTNMRLHLGMLKSLPDEFQVKMNELRNLTVSGEESVVSALQCLGEERKYKTLEEGQDNEDGDEETIGDVDTNLPTVPPAGRKATHASQSFGDVTMTSPRWSTSRYEGSTISETGLKRTDQIISQPLTISSSSSDYYGSTTTTTPRTPALTGTAIPEATAITTPETTLSISTRKTLTQTTNITTTCITTPRAPATPDLSPIIPGATDGYWPSVTQASVTPSLRPRVRTDGHSAATEMTVTQDYSATEMTVTQDYGATEMTVTQDYGATEMTVTQDYGREALTRDRKPGSSWKEINTIPPSTRKKFFPGMRHPATSTHGLWVLGRVAGHRLQDLIHRSSSHLPTRGGAPVFILNNMGRINNVTFSAGLWVRRVQNVDMGRLLRHGVPQHAATVHTSLAFSRPVQVVGPVKASAINGTPAAAFVTLAGHHVLPQPFVFTGSVTAAAHVQVRGEVSGVDLALLSRSVAVTSPVASQKLLQPVTFARVSAASVVFAHGRVRDVPLEDLVRLDRPAAITGRMTFKQLTVRVGETRITDLKSHFVNDVNLTDLFFNSLTKNPGRPLVIKGAISFNALNVLGNVTTSQGFTLPDTSGTQTLRIDRVASRVVYRDQDANVTGNLLLRGSAGVNNLIFRDSFDSVPAAMYDSDWLLKMSSQSLTGLVALAKVKAQSVTVSPGAKLKGVDINRLFKATMKVNEDKVVATPVKMSGDVWAESVRVGGTVQGWNLSTAAIHQNSSDVVFTAPKKFVGDFHVSGSLSAPDLGSAAWSRLCRGNHMERLLLVGEMQLTRPSSSDVVHLGRHVLEKDSIDGYWRMNHSAVLPSHITFQELRATHVKADLVNGEDISKLSRDVLRRTCMHGERQVVSGNFSAAFLVVQSLFTPRIATTLLNDHPVSDMENIFTRDGNQTIRGRWTLPRVHTPGSVITSGGVNGIRMTDMCVFDKPCTITAKKTFARDLTIKGDLHVQAGSTVQGVDVSEELRNVPTSTTCGPVPGLTTITGNLTVSHLVVHGVVDEVKVTSKDLLTSSGAQVMVGQLTIKAKEGVVVAAAPSFQALDGLFNGWNLSERWQRGFQRDQDIIVRKPVIFQDFVNFQNVASRPWSSERLKGLPHLRFHYLDNLSQDTTLAVGGSVSELWGWRNIQAFPGHAARLVPLGMVGGPLNTVSCPRYLVVLSRTGHARLLIYDDGQRKYRNTGVVLRGGCVRAVAGYRADGEDHVVTAHTCTDDSSDPYGNLYGPVADGLEAVQVWRVTTSGPQLVQGIPIGATDVKVAEAGERVCLVVAVSKSNATLIFCWDAMRGAFSEPRRLATGCSAKVSAVQHRDSRGRVVNLVAVAGQVHHDPHNDALSLWLHDAEQDEFLLVQRKALRGVLWVDMTSHGTDLFLVAVTRAFSGDMTGRVIVYRVELKVDDISSSPYFGAPRPAASPAPEKLYSTRRHLPNQLVHLQTLRIIMPLQAHFAAVPSGPLYLLAVGQHGNITRFTQKGVHRFAEEGLYHAPGRQEVDVWVCVEEGGRVSINLALAGTWCREETCNERRREDAEILEANFRPGPPVVGPPVIH